MLIIQGSGFNWTRNCIKSNFIPGIPRDRCAVRSGASRDHFRAIFPQTIASALSLIVGQAHLISWLFEAMHLSSRFFGKWCVLWAISEEIVPPFVYEKRRRRFAFTSHVKVVGKQLQRHLTSFRDADQDWMQKYHTKISRLENICMHYIYIISSSFW